MIAARHRISPMDLPTAAVVAVALIAAAAMASYIPARKALTVDA